MGAIGAPLGASSQQGRGVAIVSPGLIIGAMSLLSLVFGGAAMVHVMRKTHGVDHDDDDNDDNDDSDSDDFGSEDSDIDSEDLESSQGLALGVPSMHWGGLDHGRKMQLVH